MTPEDRVLFACARQDFLDEHRRTVEALARRGIRWDVVAEAAEAQGVAPIVGFQLRRSVDKLPPEVAERLERAFFENALVKAEQAQRLAEGIARLRAAGHQVMLLKGAALDLLVYREPWVVSARDVDLLLRPEPGRTLAEDEKAVRRSLYQSGVECDLHEHHDVNMNGVLPISFDRIWRDARPVSWHGADAFVMAPEDLLISLCVNACRKRFLRLKGLFDIAESTMRLQGLDWTRLAARAREDGCEGIVYAALRVTASTLGASVPPSALEDLRLHPLRVRLLRAAIARFLRGATLTRDPADRQGAGAPGSLLSLLLPYASYRWGQALRSLRFALTYEPPARRRAAGTAAGPLAS